MGGKGAAQGGAMADGVSTRPAAEFTPPPSQPPPWPPLLLLLPAASSDAHAAASTGSAADLTAWSAVISAAASGSGSTVDLLLSSSFLHLRLASLRPRPAPMAAGTAGASATALFPALSAEAVVAAVVTMAPLRRWDLNMCSRIRVQRRKSGWQTTGVKS